jgi:hypothetical protein
VLSSIQYINQLSTETSVIYGKIARKEQLRSEMFGECGQNALVYFCFLAKSLCYCFLYKLSIQYPYKGNVFNGFLYHLAYTQITLPNVVKA